MKPTIIHKIKAILSGQAVHLGSKRTLLAVSGGMDSVALAALFHEMGSDFGIAHCNFQLRGEESDGDEALVKALAHQYRVPFYSTRFDTAAYMVSRKVSVQVAARELRYQWFEEVRTAQRYDYIATAHHLNDNIETVLHNFIRGTGVKGLRGMQVRQGRLIRPLLSLSRTEIEAFCKERNLVWREDSSNASDKYTRNKIRHHLIPLIEEINPGFETGFEDRLRVFADVEAVYEAKVRREDKQLFERRGGYIYIPIRKLKKQPNRRSVLYEYLTPYGFNASQVDDILASLDAHAGRQFLSPAARIIKDRQFLILSPSGAEDYTAVLIDQDDKKIPLPHATLHISIHDAPGAIIKKENTYAYLDMDKLEFPLLLRHWKKGDYFYPFGMEMKKKKVSKYFKDQKIPLNEKEKIWMLESGKKVVWIVGERIDERYRVTRNTKKVMVIHRGIS